MRQSVFARPSRAEKSQQPICHAQSRECWLRFRTEWRRFVDCYRAASRLFRQGVWSVEFPPFCFRPWIPPLSFAPG
jgi:hypothetical protein